MLEIISAENKKVLRAASLKHKKYRDLYGEYLIEGRRAVIDAIKCGALVTCLFVTKEYNAPIPEGDFERCSVSADIMKKICQTVAPQSIAAVVKIVPAPLCKDIDCAIVLDGIKDPSNMGAIIRTAAACGIDNIFLHRCCDPYNPKSVRASMGGINFVKLFQCGEDIIDYLNQKELFVISADMDGENLYEFKMPQNKFALIIGGEADGISEGFINKSDVVLRLPMQNIESLNAAVSASVIMYHLKNYNRN